MRASFKVAYEKAAEVLSRLSYDGKDMVDTSMVKDVVEDLTGTTIQVGQVSFNEIDKKLENYGAMLKYSHKDKKAIIVLNSDKDAVFRRFSLVHELGHLITGKQLSMDDGFALSAHINYKITAISDEACDINEVLENEQIANIFALLVLMPGNAFVEKFDEYENISEVATFFGVQKEAALSRIGLGAF